jgi:hypothetical protein
MTYIVLSVICVVFLSSVSIDKAYLNVLVVISKLLGQFILGMRQLPRMNIFVLKKKIGCVIKINNTGKGQCHFRYYRKQSI